MCNITWQELRQVSQKQQGAQFQSKFTEKRAPPKFVSQPELNSNEQSDDMCTLISEINGMDENFDMKD